MKDIKGHQCMIVSGCEEQAGLVVVERLFELSMTFGNLLLMQSLRHEDHVFLTPKPPLESCIVLTDLQNRVFACTLAACHLSTIHTKLQRTWSSA